jgi:O-antigen/teichoic acid export membrane protein
MNRPELKQALLRGGLYLTIRQIFALGLSLTSVLLITRILGPVHYGWITIAISCNTFMASLADMGMKTYLIRKPGDCSEQLQGEILTFLILTGSILTAIAFLSAPWIAFWTNIPELQMILKVMSPAILLDVCSGASLGLLERRLQYQRSSLVEIGALLTYYAAAIPLVIIGWDFWGVVAAYLLQSLFQSAAAILCCPIRPSLPQPPNAVRQALHYGIGFSGAIWVNQGRGVLLPLLIGRFISAEAVGLVGATNRIADVLAFMKTIAWQLGISGFAKLQEDLPAMRQALSRAMIYQSLLLTLPLGLFACLSPVLIPFVLGQKWLGVIHLFPYIAIAVIAKGIFDLHMLVLFALGRNLDVIKFNLVNTIVIGGAIALLGSPFHLGGYIAAEMIVLTVYFLLHQSITRLMGSPNYLPVLILMLGTLIPLVIGNQLSPFLAVPLLLTGFSLALYGSSSLRQLSQELATTLLKQVRFL